MNSNVRGARVLPSEVGNFTGDLLLAGRPFHVRSNARDVEALYDGLRCAFGVIVSIDGGAPLVVMRLGDFLRECRLSAAWLSDDE